MCATESSAAQRDENILVNKIYYNPHRPFLFFRSAVKTKIANPLPSGRWRLRLVARECVFLLATITTNTTAVLDFFLARQVVGKAAESRIRFCSESRVDALAAVVAVLA